MKVSHLLGAVLVFSCSLSLYMYTLYPSISGGDSGELVVAANNLAIPHPPGYPIFTMIGHLSIQLGKLFQLSPAYSMNVMSALLGAFSSVFLFLTLVTVTNLVTALVISFIWTTSPTPWTYHTQAEVFAMNNMFLSLLLYLTAKYFTCQTLAQAKPFAILGSFICGLSLTNQHTCILYIIPLVIFVFTENVQFWSSISNISSLTVSFVLGLVPYLYLPLRSGALSRGQWGVQNTLAGFLTHFLRMEYGTFQLAGSMFTVNVGFTDRLQIYLNNLVEEVTWPIAALALTSVITLYNPKLVSRKDLFCKFLLISFFFYLIVFLNLTNMDVTPFLIGVQMRFWQHPNIIVLTLSGIGLFQLYQYHQYIGHLLVPFIIAVGCVSRTIAFPQMNHRNTVLFSQFAKMSVEHLPKSSIVLANGDLFHNTILYLHECEYFRSDLTILSPQLMSLPWFASFRGQYPEINFPGTYYHPKYQETFNIKTFIDANIDLHPVIVCGGFKDGDLSYQSFYQTIPAGYCERVLKKSEILSAEEIVLNGIQGLPDTKRLPETNNFPIHSWELVGLYETWKAALALFRYAESAFLNKSSTASISENGCAAALVLLHLHSLNVGTTGEGLLFRNIGIVCGEASIYKQHYEEAMMESWKIYLSKNEDSGIAHLVEHGINSYRGAKIGA